tara:strand:+ start:47257 stop:47448 length:192 start_codon:yes stop_codon:yes gene_type:complete
MNSDASRRNLGTHQLQVLSGGEASIRYRVKKFRIEFRAGNPLIMGNQPDTKPAEYSKNESGTG